MTKAEKVYIQVLQKIKSGAIPPGTKLTISKIAKEYEVSEIPIREVIQRLTREGFIISKPHTAPVVKSLSSDEVRQIFEIRSSLESLAARLAVQNISNAHIKELENIVIQSKESSVTSSPKEYLRLNTLFHKSLYQHCGNKMLIRMINEITNLSARYPNYYKAKETILNSIKDHQEIIDTLKKRDANYLELIIQKHLQRAIPTLMELVDAIEPTS